MIAVINEQEERFKSFLEVADCTMESFDASHIRMNPDREIDLHSGRVEAYPKCQKCNSYIGQDETVDDAVDTRIRMLKPATERVFNVEALFIFWSEQCVIAKKFYLLGHTEQAWAMLVESAQVAGGLRVATLASIDLAKDKRMTMDEFTSLFAKTGGNKRAQKIHLVELFAIQLFTAKIWKSTKQAKATLWPEVKAMAKKEDWNMSDETGPETLYKWLLAHKKIQRLQVNA